MANFDDCVQRLVDAGDLDAGDAASLRRTYGKHRARHRRLTSGSQAEQAAARDTLIEARRQAKRRRANVARAAVRREEIVSAADAHPRGFVAGASAHLSPDIHDVAGWRNAFDHIAGVRNQLLARFAEPLQRLGPKLFGLGGDRATLINIVRELYEDATGSEMARDFAAAWTNVTRYAVERFNRAGGDIRILENELTAWRLPQVHDQQRIARAGYDAWREMIGDADLSLMAEYHGMTIDDVNVALRDVYETLRTDGLNTLNPARPSVGRALANRGVDQHRFLLFASADSWLAYNGRFGAGDVYSLMAGHLESMARQIGLIETLGPNPRAMVESLVNEAIQRGATAETRSGTAQRFRRALGFLLQVVESPSMLRHTYAELTGSVNAVGPDAYKRILARGMTGLRNVLQLAQLGSATLSAVTDFVAMRETAAWNALPMTRALKYYLRVLNPANAADRRTAVRMGLGAEIYISAATAGSRYADDLVGTGVTGWLVDGFHKISGLTPHTQAGKWAVGFDFLATWGDLAGKPYRNLPKAMQRQFRRYGIDSGIWETARQFPTDDSMGTPMLNPVGMVESGDSALAAAGEALHGMILAETRFAIPEPDARARAAMRRGQARGSIMGEIANSLSMYKSFASTVLLTHLGRTLAPVAGEQMTRGAYGLRMVIGMTVMGAVAMQMKAIAQGRDPQAMDTPAFWSAALVQGGGLGIFGDFLFGPHSRTDADILMTAAGPVAGFAVDVNRLLSRGRRETFEGEDMSLRSELLRFTRRYTPGTNLWYARLVGDRMLWDQLALLADPAAARGFARLQRRQRLRTGQAYYWPPGVTAPQRAPDLGAALAR